MRVLWIVFLVISLEAFGGDGRCSLRFATSGEMNRVLAVYEELLGRVAAGLLDAEDYGRMMAGNPLELPDRRSSEREPIREALERLAAHVASQGLVESLRPELIAVLQRLRDAQEDASRRARQAREELVVDIPPPPHRTVTVGHALTLAISRDGKILAKGPEGTKMSQRAFGGPPEGWGPVAIWDLDRGLETQRLDFCQGDVVGLSISDDGRFVAAMGKTGQAGAWDLTPQAKPAGRWGFHQSGYASLVLGRANPAGIFAVASAGEYVIGSRHGGGLGAWTLRRADALLLPPITDMHVTSLALSGDGKQIALGLGDGTVAVWGIDGTKLLPAGLLFPAHSGPVTSMALSPGGEILVSFAQDGVRYWHRGSPGGPRPLDGPPLGAGLAAWAPDSRWFAVASTDGLVRLFDGKTGRLRFAFRAHDELPILLRATSDDTLVSGDALGNVHVWDLSTLWGRAIP